MRNWFAKKKIGLALGGGAARGLAHIGVLQAFEESDLQIDLITGTSMGAIIGAMYATNPDLKLLRQQMIAYLQSDIFKKARLDFVVERKNEPEGEGLFYRFSQLARKKIFFAAAMTMVSFVSQETRDKSLGFLLSDTNIEDTRLPFATVALDLISGKEIVIKSGSMLEAIAATCALPGILPPVEYNSMKLVDGGWINAIPVVPAKELGADIVIAVDVGSDFSQNEQFDSGLDVVLRADTATRNALSNLQLKQANIVICPAVGINHWADFSRADEIIAKGRDAALKRMPEIKKMLKKIV
ncbi:MAG: patatin-like phospholipase family protein [Desulfuromusa sp.]|nr:patatin-like phospholipase family protein [Desulfuromusa sp.]